MIILEKQVVFTVWSHRVVPWFTEGVGVSVWLNWPVLASVRYNDHGPIYNETWIMGHSKTANASKICLKSKIFIFYSSLFIP